MAKRKPARTQRVRPAPTKLAGAALIALALLAGVSLVPPQTAALPRFLAARLAEGFGAAAAAAPALCFLLGLWCFVEETFRLSARLWGVLLGYLVALVALHLRYPAGHEFAAASGGHGGGYLGAALTVAVRRALGEPGLWAAVALGAAACVLLLAGVSATGVLRALGPWAGGTARACAVAARGLVAFALAAARAALRALRRALAGAGRACARTAWLCAVRTYRAAARLARAAASARAKPAPAAAPAPRADPAEPQDGAWEPRGAPGGPAARPAEPAAARVDPAPGTGTGAPAPAPGEEPAGAPSPPDDDALREPAVLASRRTAAPQHLAAEGSGRGREGAGRARRRRPAAAQEALAFSAEPARAYALPDLSLLDAFPAGRARSGKVDPEEVARNLERTLASFGVEARVVRWETGPVVTRYELQPAPGVKVQKITSLQNDIALALAASSVRLEAPIPGKSAIGVELPNERPGLVHLREILGSEEFQSSSSPLAVAVGKGIAGTPVVADLVAMPHLLIAGATGAGKSVAINSMIASILFRATPEQARFLMIDPKRVELTNYNGIPHLLSPVVTGPREAAAKLRWAIQEMESRYEMFAQDGVRNIQAFNAQHPDRPLAYVLIIIDELADLMMIAPADFEEIICRLAQMTRATGIHLLVATQRPSVDVITGLIKANIPSRIAFSVTSQVDSRTILDHPGAEKLLGRGDMLFAPIGATRPTRVQGAFISDAETERLVRFWRGQGEPAYVESLLEAGGEPAPDEAGGDDALLVDAARLVVRAGYASVSLLQRKMRIGYVRAARVVDQLEEKGIVGPAQGSSPREVLVGLDDLERVLRAGSSARGARPPAVAPDDGEDA